LSLQLHTSVVAMLHECKGSKGLEGEVI